MRKGQQLTSVIGSYRKIRIPSHLYHRSEAVHQKGREIGRFFLEAFREPCNAGAAHARAEQAESRRRYRQVPQRNSLNKSRHFQNRTPHRPRIGTILRGRYLGVISESRHVRGQDIEGCQAGRFTGGATDQVPSWRLTSGPLKRSALMCHRTPYCAPIR